MDLQRDNSRRTWIKIASERQAPDYVLNYEPMCEKTAGAMDSELFADPVHRAFPVHDAPSTWLSAAYFAENKDQVQPGYLRKYAEEAIRHAAAVHGITSDVTPLLAPPARPEPGAPTMGKVAADAGVRGLPDYPVRSASDVKTACDHFSRHFGRYAPEDRKGVALAIVKKAGHFGAHVPRLLLQEAGECVPYKPSVIEALAGRARMCKDAGAAAVVGQLAIAVNDFSAEDMMEHLAKIAGVMDAIDEATGASRMYGRGMPTPYQSMGGMTVKEAADLVADTVDIDGIPFSAVKLASLGAPFYADTFGGDFVDSVSSGGGIDPHMLKDVLDTLPLPDKQAFKSALSQSLSDGGR
jgi:hypothetical protein